MKKNKLIELLNSIEGNPEIVIWNGYAEDYMHIDPSIEPLVLVKESAEFIFTCIRAEYCNKHRTVEIPESKISELKQKAEELHKQRDWDSPNQFVTEEEMESWYGSKRRKFFMLSPKLRNKTSYGMDRASDVNY